MTIQTQTFKAVIFDLDGVITKTATIHAESWKVMFDEYLHLREEKHKESFVEFSIKDDYLKYVDGKPRYKGVESFLQSRNIELTFGSPDDSSDKETICGLGNQKNVKFIEILNTKGIDVYESTVRLINELKEAQVRIGIASSSKNCQFVLKTAKLEHLFETRVDGVVSAELGLKGKPEGDIFVKAAENLGISPKDAIVVEDALSGVEAGKNGKFGLVIGLDREGHGNLMKERGADIVIEDFAGITKKDIEQWFQQKNAQ